MHTAQLLNLGVALSWALNIYFFSRFALDWRRNEPEPGRALLALAAVCVPALLLTLFVSVRAGYDNDHVFECLGATLFAPRHGNLFKEVSPLFTDRFSDLLSGNSLRALLWKNRLLFAASAFVFFTGLRRLGAGLAVGAAACAFLFLNFLAALNANTFSTTSTNIFIWLLSLAAIIDAYRSPALGTAGLLWILSSMILVISARFEFLPVNLLLFAALLASRPRAELAALLKPLRLALLGVFLAFMAAYARQVYTDPSVAQAGYMSFSAGTLFYQLGAQNFSVIAGSPPVWTSRVTGPQEAPWARLSGKAGVLSAAFIVLMSLCALAGGRADRPKLERNGIFLSLLGAWAAYFSYIYFPHDLYPLHFIRHQLYFFVPFAFLFALGLDGLETLSSHVPAFQRKALLFLCAVLLGCYALFNAAAALRLNPERRTDDIELEFLAGSQKDWEKDCLLLYAGGEPRLSFLKRYFPFRNPCSQDGGACLLEYISPASRIFTDRTARPADRPSSATGPENAWRSLSFKHAFYTSMGIGAGRIRETAEPLPLTIGFFRAGKGERSGPALPARGGRAADGGCAAPVRR